MVGLAILSLALFTTVRSSRKAQKGTYDQANARYVAEAGMAVAMMNLAEGAPVEMVAQGSEGAQIDFGGATYWVSATSIPQSNLFELTATGLENGVGSRLTAVLREVSDNTFVWAAFGDEGVSMDSNAMVDSYNSNLGSYDDQDVNGNGSGRYALSSGNIGSNGSISADSNVEVHGDATPGPGATASFNGNSTVSGSTTPATSLIEIPEIILPDLTSLGNKNFNGSGSGAFNDFIPTGEYRWNQGVVDMSLEVIGPATLVFSSLTIDSNSQIIVDATNGPVEIYVEGDFVLNSNAIIASTAYNPSDITLNLLSDNVIDPNVDVDLDEVDFDSNAQLYGTLLAPNASIEINSNFELFGSLVARRVHLDSNSKIHFDEALLGATSNGERTLQPVAWHHMPYHQ